MTSQTDRNKRHFYATALTGLVAVALAVSHLIDLGQSSWLTAALKNALHIPAFGVAAVVALLIFRRYEKLRFPYIWAAGSLLFVGAALEAAQVFGPRDGDISDLVRDAIGIASFLLSYAVFEVALDRSHSVIIRFLSYLGSLLLVSAACAPAAYYAFALVAREQQFPVLLSFERHWENTLTARTERPIGILPAPPGWPANGKQVAMLDLSAQGKESLALEPRPDWSSFEQFSFVAASASPRPQTVTLRIHDETHNHRHGDRFNLSLTVKQEPQRFVIDLKDVESAPASRFLDLSNIAAVIVFAPVAGLEAIYIDEIKLE